MAVALAALPVRRLATLLLDAVLLLVARDAFIAAIVVPVVSVVAIVVMVVVIPSTSRVDCATRFTRARLGDDSLTG